MILVISNDAAIVEEDKEHETEEDRVDANGGEKETVAEDVETEVFGDRGGQTKMVSKMLSSVSSVNGEVKQW